MTEEDSADDVVVLHLEDFADDCKKLDIGAFCERHGDGFLLHEGPLEPARRARKPQRTVVFGKPNASMAPASRPTPKRDMLVFPVRTTGRSPYPRIITVGRTKNNDIVLADVAISKFHAFFKEEEGQYFLQDAGSRNGTFVNDGEVPDKKHGKPLCVEPGALVRFGAVELKFIRGGDLYDLASKRKV
jgi:hypothetical protein